MLLSKIGGENLELRTRVLELESANQRMKEELRRTAKNHKAELRWRDKKEIGVGIGVGIVNIVYVVSALMIRGFV